MGVIDPGMESMLEVFIYESTTLLEQLDEILLDSEKDKNMQVENINEIFRIMHTIKGSSAMMGLSGISNLAHAVEDVFAIIRETPSKMGPQSEAIFNLVFQSSDFLKSEIEAVQSSDYAPKDPSGLIERLENEARLLNGEEAEAPPAAGPEVSSAASATSPAGTGGTAVQVFFEDGCQMENVRAFMLLKQLEDCCESVESTPPHPENDASLCGEIIKNGLLIRFCPASALDAVVGLIEKSVNVRSYQVVDEAAPPAPRVEQEPGTVQAAPAAQQSAPAANNAVKNVKQSLISVNQSKLDQLMDLVGELVTTESMVSSSPDLAGLRLDNFTKSTRDLRKLTDELQSVVMSMRMVPLNGVFQKMHRIIRDMSKKLDKEVEFETFGGDTEVDKTIVDSLQDPLMHMIRNSMDHAIESPEERVSYGKSEQGKVTLSAQNVGGEIVIRVSDDGRGLDTEKILKKARTNGILNKPESEYTDKEIFGLIMLPGFSTNEQVTEYSGRGVGMDVVHQNIEKIGGSISIDSYSHRGTEFTIKIPLTLAIVEGMEISVGKNIFILPITSIRQSFKVADPNQIMHNTTTGTEMILIRGECHPIIRLHRQFQISTEVTELTDGILIQIENNQTMACIFADQLLGQQSVVVKGFPNLLNRFGAKGHGISGCTILGDGSISLILDANSLLNN